MRMEVGQEESSLTRLPVKDLPAPPGVKEQLNNSYKYPDFDVRSNSFILQLIHMKIVGQDELFSSHLIPHSEHPGRALYLTFIYMNAGRL